MSGLLAAVSSLLSKESRPPIVGQEVVTFHELGLMTSESHTTQLNKMESQETTQCFEAKESVDRPNSSETKRTDKDFRNELPSNPSPPPPYKWAQSLQCLLDDMQGVELFQRFLKQEGQDTRCLDFLFACRGVKKTAVEGEKLLKLVQVLYDKKVNRIAAISDETKREIKRRISSKVDVDVNIFDEAQRQVERNILRTTYPNFLTSDLYIQHLGANQCEVGEECPGSPAEQCLSTVHEDSELHFPEKPHFVMEGSYRRRPARSATMHLAKARSETGSYLKSPYSAYHTKYGTFLPTSAQDSELQSLSSDAQTDDTISISDSSVDCPMSRSRQKRFQKKGNMYLNRDDLNDFNFIPRTQRLEMEKKNYLDPQQLMKKLTRLADERNAKEQVYEKLRNIEASNKPCKPAAQDFDANFFLQPTEDNCQDILDRHVSRVFDDSGETPVLSPDCASPPVARPEAYDAAQDLSYTISQKVGLTSPFSVLSAAKHKREHDTRSSDSGAVTEWISDDNLAAGSRSALAPRMSREQSRRSCRRSCTVNDSASSCVDSGISEICEPVLHSHSKVAHWLEAKRCSSESEKDWKHSPTSPVLSRSSSSQKATTYRIGECAPNTGHGFTQRSAAIQPQQPFAQDLPMSAPDTTSNLIETRRRLEDDVRVRIAKSRHASGIAKTRQSFRVSDVPEDGISHRKQSKKSLENAAGSNDVTVIGYSYGQGAVPFLIRYQGKNITLKNFKSLLSKKGNFKYYFKKVENAFGTGTVLEEVSDDHAVLPLWEGKVFCVIETVDDVSTSTEEEKASQ